MNERSVEYGWRIEGHGFKSLYEAMGLDVAGDQVEQARLEEHLEILCAIKGIDNGVETHPMHPDRWFASIEELTDKFPKEPKRIAKAVKQWAKRFAPKAKVVWGIIHTER